MISGKNLALLLLSFIRFRPWLNNSFNNNNDDDVDENRTDGPLLVTSCHLMSSHVISCHLSNHRPGYGYSSRNPRTATRREPGVLPPSSLCTGCCSGSVPSIAAQKRIQQQPVAENDRQKPR